MAHCGALDAHKTLLENISIKQRSLLSWKGHLNSTKIALLHTVPRNLTIRARQRADLHEGVLQITPRESQFTGTILIATRQTKTVNSVFFSS